VVATRGLLAELRMATQRDQPSDLKLLEFREQIRGRRDRLMRLRGTVIRMAELAGLLQLEFQPG